MKLRGSDSESYIIYPTVKKSNAAEIRTDLLEQPISGTAIGKAFLAVNTR